MVKCFSPGSHSPRSVVRRSGVVGKMSCRLTLNDVHQAARLLAKVARARGAEMVGILRAASLALMRIRGARTGSLVVAILALTVAFAVTSVAPGNRPRFRGSAS